MHIQWSLKDWWKYPNKLGVPSVHEGDTNFKVWCSPQIYLLFMTSLKLDHSLVTFSNCIFQIGLQVLCLPVRFAQGLSGLQQITRSLTGIDPRKDSLIGFIIKERGLEQQHEPLWWWHIQKEKWNPWGTCCWEEKDHGWREESCLRSSRWIKRYSAFDTSFSQMSCSAATRNVIHERDTDRERE